jgi:hypothetical protein
VLYGRDEILNFATVLSSLIGTIQLSHLISMAVKSSLLLQSSKITTQAAAESQYHGQHEFSVFISWKVCLGELHDTPPYLNCLKS